MRVEERNLIDTLCHEYLIKMVNKNLFMEGPESSAGLPSLGSRKDANTYIIEHTDDPRKVLIYIKELPNQVLDIPNGSTTLIFYPKHGLQNQLFELIPLDFIRGYRLMQNDQCLGYSADEKFFRLQDCVRGNANQMFEFICVDCPGKKAFVQPSSTTVAHEHFLNDATQKLIQNIGKLAVDMNTCFSTNGTCKATDYSHIQLFCTDPYYGGVHEVWPDMKNDFAHLSDLESDPLAVDVDNYDFLHQKSLEHDNHLRHIDSEHPQHVLNEIDLADHAFQNEDLYHGPLMKNITSSPVNFTEAKTSGKLSNDIKSPIAQMADQKAKRNAGIPDERDPIIIIPKEKEPENSAKILDSLGFFLFN